MSAKAETVKSNAKVFWWTLGILGILLCGLIAFSMSTPDSPFTYVLH